MSKGTHTFRTEPGNERARAVVVGTKGPPVVACSRHPAVRATFHCNACGKFACEACVERKLIGTIRDVICPCTGPCDALNPRELGAWRAKTFRERLRDACSYPLRGNGVAMFVTSTLTIGVARWMIGGPNLYMMLIGILAFTMVIGYVVGWWLSIVPHTVNGGSDPPDWPDLINLWDEALAPLVRVLAASVVVVVPTVATMVITQSRVAGALVFVASMAAFVPVLANLALSDSMRVAFDPREWIALVRQAGVAHVVLAGCTLAAAATLHASISAATGVLGGLGSLVSAAALTWTAMAAMRLLGVMLRDR